MTARVRQTRGSRWNTEYILRGVRGRVMDLRDGGWESRRPFVAGTVDGVQWSLFARPLRGRVARNTGERDRRMMENIND